MDTSGRYGNPAETQLIEIHAKKASSMLLHSPIGGIEGQLRTQYTAAVTGPSESPCPGLGHGHAGARGPVASCSCPRIGLARGLRRSERSLCGIFFRDRGSRRGAWTRPLRPKRGPHCCRTAVRCHSAGGGKVRSLRIPRCRRGQAGVRSLVASCSYPCTGKARGSRRSG